MPRPFVRTGVSPTSRIAAIAIAASRRQAASGAAVVEVVVEAAVDEVAESLGTSIGEINAAVATVESTIVSLDTRVYNLENPEP